MRRITLGALLGAGLLMAAMAGRGSTEPAFGQAGGVAPYPRPGGDLITHVTAADGLPLTITVIEPHERWIGVYQVDRASGEINLVSARNFTWDLKLIDYNCGKPLPQAIRGGLPQ